MSDLARFCRRLGAALALAVVVAGGTAVAAQAEYGEIGRFGSAGSGEGQFETAEDASFGVNPTNNDVYVVDLVKNKAGETENEFRIQRFDPNSKGEYPAKPTATVVFKPVDEELKNEEVDEVSNVAVDPEKNRIYILASEERPEKKGKTVIDSGQYAAAQLWSFNIEGEGLVSVNGKKALAGTGVLKPLAEATDEFLLDPNGIAVDPTTHDVVLLGEEERGQGKPVDALERITEAGKLAEARWTDTTNAEEPQGSLEDEADSPVVTKNGEILLVHPGLIDEIDEIPGTLASEGKPTPVYSANPEVEEQPVHVEQLTNFPSTSDEEPRGGGALSLGADGTLYARAGITEQDPELHKGSLGGPEYPGVLLFSSAKAEQKAWSEEGWTGGQSVTSVGKEGPCKVSTDVYSQIAAGSEHHVFVFDENPTKPKIIEFGPGGKGCPKGRVSTPVASTPFSGGKIAEDVPISIEEPVTLSSELVESNALGVEWEFGDGATKSVTTDEHQTTAVEHTFVEGGELEVTEKIHTDDLAEPELVIHRKILIEGPPPKVVAKAPTEITATTATLRATVNPESSNVTECKFEYGTTTAYGETAPCTPSPGGGNKPVEVSAAISGLTAGTIYDVKVVAANKLKGTGHATTTFETEAATTTKDTLSISRSGAGKVECEVDAKGSFEVCAGEYAAGTKLVLKETPEGGSTFAGWSAGSGSASVCSGTSMSTCVFVLSADSAITAAWTAPPAKEEPTLKQEEPNLKVLPFKEASATVAVAGSTTVSSAGAFTLKLQCPAGATSCTGTITLKTPKAVVASVAHMAKKQKAEILTLATGSFVIAGGQVKSVTLHLSLTARALLARSHVLSVLATIVAHNANGEAATAKASLTLRPAKAAKKR